MDLVQEVQPAASWQCLWLASAKFDVRRLGRGGAKFRPPLFIKQNIWCREGFLHSFCETPILNGVLRLQTHRDGQSPNARSKLSLCQTFCRFQSYCFWPKEYSNIDKSLAFCACTHSFKLPGFELSIFARVPLGYLLSKFVCRLKHWGPRVEHD